MEEHLEHHEHAEHAAGHGSKRAALLVAILAALLAVSEQGAKHAEIRVSENAIAASDAWAQYQGKSIRQALAHDIAELAASQPAPPEAAAAAARTTLLGRLAAEQAHYESDPADGKAAIADRAHGFESERDQAALRTHAYDNAAAAFELGIVLATVSVIASSAPLLAGSIGLGCVGIALALLGLLAPGYGAF